MEDFTSDFLKLLKPAASSFSELNFNMEPLTSHVHGLLDYLSSDIINSNNPNSIQPPYSNEPLYPSVEASGTHQSLFCPFDQANAHVVQSLPSYFMEMSSSPGSKIDKDNGIIGGRKRKGKSEGEMEKAREVIHVRAKRGQATDSHSLAERVRRERINEKLRVLQDLVPGCYKTMGMAVMLDVIINYVQSLQNQIEFLSMKLSAASLFYDFNSPEAEALETLQRTAGEARGEKQIPPRVHSTRPF